jgi:acylphosphatase
MSNTVRVHVWISGQVQGVGVSGLHGAMARKAGVGGWVRICGMGRVEAVFEGSPAAVEAMLRWCQQGSPGSVVEAIEQRPELPEGLSTFEIPPTV